LWPIHERSRSANSRHPQASLAPCLRLGSPRFSSRRIIPAAAPSTRIRSLAASPVSAPAPVLDPALGPRLFPVQGLTNPRSSGLRRQAQPFVKLVEMGVIAVAHPSARIAGAGACPVPTAQRPPKASVRLRPVFLRRSHDGESMIPPASQCNRVKAQVRIKSVCCYMLACSNPLPAQRNST